MLRVVPTEPTTERVRSFYTGFAHRYDRSIKFSDRILSIPEGRRWIASMATGEVLEVGVGTGLNLPLYDPDVRLTGLDLSPAMLAEARRRASELGMEVDLREGDAQATDLPSDRFDTVVFSLCLCSIPDDRRAVAEGKRVLRPGGRMLLIEHVRSPSPVVRAGQRLLDPLFLRLQAHHLTREPLVHLRAEGMEIGEVQRWAWGIMERVSARKPVQG
jgi:ubiquinone/menaquinone biosynthesis C-methylase UbiE